MFCRFFKLEGFLTANLILYFITLAKVIGFDSSIIQGWRGGTRVVKGSEGKNNEIYTSIEVGFTSHISLPSLQKVEWIKEDNKKIGFSYY